MHVLNQLRYHKMKKTETSAILAATVIIFALIAYGTWTAGSGSQTPSPASNQVPATTWQSAPPHLVASLGPVITLNQAAQFVGPLTLPTVLPNDLHLDQIRGTPLSVSLLYTSPTLPPFPNWDYNFSVGVDIMKDGTSYQPLPPYQSGGHAVIQCGTGSASVTTIGQQATTVVQTTNCTTLTYEASTSSQSPIENIAISGHPGNGWDPGGPTGDFGEVTWWANGLHYSISGALPMTTLEAMATSMNI